MGQYRTKRLTVTKSYIRYHRTRLYMNEIVEISRPKTDPAILTVSAIFTVFAAASGWSFWWLGLGGILMGLMPPFALHLYTVDGRKIYLNLRGERSPNRAIHTIFDNVQEYQARQFAPPTHRPLVVYRQSPAICSYSHLPPEEQIRQYALQLLKVNYGFSQADIGYEFPIKMGSSTKRADLVVFHPHTPHIQDNIKIIVECKRLNIGNDGEAIDQLKSYMAACANVKYGVVASYRWYVIEKGLVDGRFHYAPTSMLMGANGVPISIDYMPGNPVVPSAPEPPQPYRYDFPEEDMDDVIEEEPSSFRINWHRIAYLGVFACFGIFALSNIVQLFSGVRFQIPYIPSSTVIRATEAPTDDGVFSLNMPTIGYFVTFTPSQNTLAAPPTATSTSTLADTARVQPTDMPISTPTAPPPSAATVTPSNRRFGAVNASRNVNMRLSDSTSAIIVAVLRPNTRVEIIGENDDGSWLQVRLEGGTTGWVASFLVDVE